MHRYELYALPSFLVYWCVVFCILCYRFVVSMKNLYLDWPLSGWGCGLTPLAYTVIRRWPLLRTVGAVRTKGIRIAL